MSPGKSHELQNVMVVHRVKHLAARTARPDEPHGPEQPELVGDRRFAHAYERRDVAHTQFPVGERIEDPDARRVTEHAEGLGKNLDRAALHQPTPSRFGACGVEMRCIAGIVDSWLGFGDSGSSRHLNI